MHSHSQQVCSAAATLRSLVGVPGSIRPNLAELVEALEQYRTELDSGLLGTMPMRRAFHAIELLQETLRAEKAPKEPRSRPERPVSR